MQDPVPVALELEQSGGARQETGLQDGQLGAPQEPAKHWTVVELEPNPVWHVNVRLLNSAAPLPAIVAFVHDAGSLPQLPGTRVHVGQSLPVVQSQKPLASQVSTLVPL